MTVDADQPATTAGLAWQIGVWDRISDRYTREIDARFAPVIEQVIAPAALQPGENALDLGTGTGAVALRAAPLVLPAGTILAVDPQSGNAHAGAAASSGPGTGTHHRGRGFRHLNQLAVLGMFFIHSVRYAIYLSPGRGRRTPPQVGTLSLLCETAY